MSTCCLCSNLVSEGSNKVWNKPLFESTNFVVLPSLGSLVEGWMLLVPKKHFICMGALPVDLAREMAFMKCAIAARLYRQYGEVCVFEHGPGAVNHEVGCGVDHAHLHMVPLAFELTGAATQFMPTDTKWIDAGWESCRAAFEEGQDYLYLEQPIGVGRIAVHTGFGSQVFRKAIALCLGIPEQFNWRQYPQTEIVARTIQTLRGSTEVAVPA